MGHVRRPYELHLHALQTKLDGLRRDRVSKMSPTQATRAAFSRVSGCSTKLSKLEVEKRDLQEQADQIQEKIQGGQVGDVQHDDEVDG